MIILVLGGALLLTAGVEALALWLWFRSPKFCYYSFLGNLLTNPLLNGVLAVTVYYLPSCWYWRLLPVLELLAVVAEAVVLNMLCRFTRRKSLWVSFVINLSSFCTGFLIQWAWK